MSRISRTRGVCYPRVVRRLFSLSIPLSFLAVAVCAPCEAKAEASAWVSVGAGAIGLKQKGEDFTFRSTLAFDAGVGTSPTNSFIFGGLFRISPIIKEGTDLSIVLRGATRGFQTGPFGIAIDAGPYLRTFGSDPLPTVGGVGGIVLGGPLGTQLAIMGSGGMHDAFSVNATLGLDLLRLTVYRQSLLEWWPNPSSPSVQQTAVKQTASSYVSPVAAR